MTRGFTTAELVMQAATLDVGGLFRTQARYVGTRIALEHGSRRYTYAELDDRVNRLANALAALGVVRGDRVGILSENRPEYLELELAAAKLGAIVAALNWRLTSDELDHCIRLAEPGTLLVSPRYRAQLLDIVGGTIQVVCFGEQYEALLTRAATTEPVAVARPEDGLVILYTSGTTGPAKGALVSHRAAIARAQILYFDYQLRPDDAFVAWAPLFHMVSTDHALATLMHGGKVIVVDGFAAQTLADIVARESLGWLVLMPGIVQTFIDAMRRADIRPVGVKVTGAMADLVPLHEIAEVTTLLRAPFMNTFGSTETGLPPASRGLIGVGEVPSNLAKTQSSYCEIRLVGESDDSVPDGEPGELAIRGPSLFSGYWNAPETNARDFRGGWFHGGDVFVRHPDGTLAFVDRRKYLIKSGGENIYPAEIERLLLADARIGEAVVVRKSDERWGEVPVVYVVRKHTDLTAADVMACCEGRVARYKLPKEIHFVEDADLPRSATGKVQRHALEAALVTRRPG